MLDLFKPFVCSGIAQISHDAQGYQAAAEERYEKFVAKRHLSCLPRLRWRKPRFVQYRVVSVHRVVYRYFESIRRAFQPELMDGRVRV
jgi:hypothetical protein